MLKTLNIFKQLWVSIFSPKDIASFQNQGIGKTILYVFFISLIAFLPSAYYFGTMIVDGIDAMHETVSEDLPAFEIKNGTLTTEEDEPFSLNKNGYQIFVDGTGALTPEKVAAESDEAVALLKSDLVFVSGGNVQSSPYSVLEEIIRKFPLGLIQLNLCCRSSFLCFYSYYTCLLLAESSLK